MVVVVHHPEGDVHLVLLLLDAAAAHHGRMMDRSTYRRCNCGKHRLLAAAAAAGARRNSIHTGGVLRVYIPGPAAAET